MICYYQQNEGKSCVIVLIDTEKNIWQNSAPFHDKEQATKRQKENCITAMKTIHEKHTAAKDWKLSFKIKEQDRDAHFHFHST